MVTQITIKGLDNPLLRMDFQFVGFQGSSLGEFFFTKLARMTEALKVRFSMPPKVKPGPIKGRQGMTWS